MRPRTETAQELKYIHEIKRRRTSAGLNDAKRYYTLHALGLVTHGSFNFIAIG